MSREIRKIVSSTSGKEANYAALTELPSGFRMLPELDPKLILVRGLYFIESLALAKFIDRSDKSINYPQLYNIYKDVIKFPDGSPYELLDLELVDFLTLMIISSLHTTTDFHWDLSIRCSDVSDGEQCTGILEKRITLDDFDFDVPNLPEPQVDVRINNVDLSISPLTLRDIINIENFSSQNPSIDRSIVEYAHLIKKMNGKDQDIQMKVNFISYSDPNEISQLATIYDDYQVKLNPLLVKCPKCGHVNRVKLGLFEIRGYP